MKAERLVMWMIVFLLIWETPLKYKRRQQKIVIIWSKNISCVLIQPDNFTFSRIISIHSIIYLCLHRDIHFVKPKCFQCYVYNR